MDSNCIFYINNKCIKQSNNSIMDQHNCIRNFMAGLMQCAQCGLPLGLFWRLQLVQNVVFKLLVGRNYHQHITPFCVEFALVSNLLLSQVHNTGMNI